MSINKDRMANSTDSDQTAPKEQSDLGLHCLQINACCSNISNIVVYKVFMICFALLIYGIMQFHFQFVISWGLIK